MTYREKAVTILQDNMSIKDKDSAENILQLIINDGYAPKIFGKLNAPKNLDEWDIEIPVTKEDYISLFHKMWNSISEKIKSEKNKFFTSEKSIKAEIEKEYFGDNTKDMLTGVDACAYYLANNEDKSIENYKDFEHMVLEDDRLLDNTPQPPYHSLYKVQFETTDLLREVSELERQTRKNHEYDVSDTVENTFGYRDEDDRDL